MLTNKNDATAQQRATAHEIWNALDALCLDKPVSTTDFYAVWGLINAILNNKGWGDAAYADWMVRLHEVWADVKGRYTN